MFQSAQSKDSKARLKILVIKMRALGDTVLMTAPLLELIQAYPDAQIDVAVPTLWAPVLTGLPGIHHIWEIPNHKGTLKRMANLGHLAFELRKQNYDYVINFHASPTSAKISWATGAETRSIHFHGHSDPNLYSTVMIPGKGTVKPIIERDMDTVRALGLQIPAGRMPQVFLQPAEKQQAQEYLDKLGLDQPILGLSLGASRPAKSWPMDRFVELAVAWCQNGNGAVLAIAGPNEVHLIYDFLKTLDDLLLAIYEDASARAKIRSRICTTYLLSVRMLAAVLGQLSALAGNDSGPKHLAVAVGTPTVTAFGPEDPFEWHPYALKRHPYEFIKSLECRPSRRPDLPGWCGIHQCTIEKHKCMHMIGVNAMLGHCQTVAELPETRQ